MKCPFRVNMTYPDEGENHGLQSWADCEEAACPFYLDGTCARVLFYTTKMDALITAIEEID